MNFGDLVGHLEGAQVGEAELRLLLQVDLGDEELHPLLEIAAEHPRGPGGNAVAVLAEPGLQPVALLGGEDQDVVLAHRVGRLDGDPQALRAARRRAACAGGAGAAAAPWPTTVEAGRGLVEVLDESRRRVGVQMIEERPLGDVDLLALEEGGDGDDDGELFRIALEVVGHGEDRAVAVAHQDHLGGLVEQLGVGLGDVEAAEAEGGAGRPWRGQPRSEAG